MIKPNNILVKKFDYTFNSLGEKSKIVLKKFTYTSENTNKFANSKLQKNLLKNNNFYIVDKENKIIVLIQARSNSKRFYNKVLNNVYGYPLIYICYKRV